MKILITGGHVTCAAAVIDKLFEKGESNIVYIGRKYTAASRVNFTLEYELISERNVTFIDFPSPRINSALFISSLVNLLKAPFAFVASFNIVRREKPHAILCFGGSIGFFISVVGWLFKIPLFVHEQTLSPGLTNRLIARLASRIFISFPQTAHFFRNSRVVVTGNPIRRQIFETINKPFNLKKDKKIIYITGGSQGAHSINIIIEKCLDRLLSRFILIHQTGESQYRDFDRLMAKNKPNYYLKKKFLDDEIGYVYNKADLIIGRAGANTIFELIALRKPAILIPLPWAANKEQKIHAKFMNEAAVAYSFSQNDSVQNFVSQIEKAFKNLDQMIKNYQGLRKYYKDDAADQIVEKILAKI